MNRFLISSSLAATLLWPLAAQAASAEPSQRYASRHHRVTMAAADPDRPLTINGRRGRGIYRSGNDIIAPGGFSAHGYGYPPATPDERREAVNARIRQNATGLYGSGLDGLGGTGFENGLEQGYSNPYYGNTFSSYVGYNGVPTDLAFGPAFANRHIANHDPDDDDDAPGPTPGDLGYGVDPAP